MLLCSFIQELCIKEGNNKTGCCFNFELQKFKSILWIQKLKYHENISQKINSIIYSKIRTQYACGHTILYEGEIIMMMIIIIIIAFRNTEENNWQSYAFIRSQLNDNWVFNN